MLYRIKKISRQFRVLTELGYTSDKLASVPPPRGNHLRSLDYDLPELEFLDRLGPSWSYFYALRAKNDILLSLEARVLNSGFKPEERLYGGYFPSVSVLPEEYEELERAIHYELPFLSGWRLDPPLRLGPYMMKSFVKRSIPYDIIADEVDCSTLLFNDKALSRLKAKYADLKIVPVYLAGKQNHSIGWCETCPGRAHSIEEAIGQIEAGTDQPTFHIRGERSLIVSKGFIDLITREELVHYLEFEELI